MWNVARVCGRGHADLVPRVPVETDGPAVRPLAAIPRDQFAEHVAGHAIVGLPVAAQPAADRAEADEVAYGILSRQGHQVVRAVDLRADGSRHVVARLALEARRAIDAGAVEDAFDRAVAAADFVQNGRQRRPVGHVAPVIGRRHARIGIRPQRAGPSRSPSRRAATPDRAFRRPGGPGPSLPP